MEGGRILSLTHSSLQALLFQTKGDDNTLKPIITLYFQLDFAGCHKSEQTSICRHQTQQQPFANSDSTIVSRIFFMKYVSSRIM